MPPVAVVDFDLPGMNGVELIRRLEARHDDLLAVLLTANDRDTLRPLMGKVGAKYLQKPLLLPSLLELRQSRRDARSNSPW